MDEPHEGDLADVGMACFGSAHDLNATLDAKLQADLAHVRAARYPEARQWAVAQIAALPPQQTFATVDDLSSFLLTQYRARRSMDQRPLELVLIPSVARELWDLAASVGQPFTAPRPSAWPKHRQVA